MSTAGIDVIVPCYNYGRFLRQCTHSVLQETRLPIRILIIDDASTDGSADDARKIAMEDDRVEVVVHQANRGHIATYNEGISWLQSPYMLLLSADDMVAPGALARAIALMEAEPGVAFVHGRSVQFTDEAELLGVRDDADAPAAGVQAGGAFIREICSKPDNPIETATAVVRTEIQKRVGGYCPQLPHSGDMEMWLRCAAHGDVGSISAVQAFTRIHATNMRHGYSGERIIADYRQRSLAFETFFDMHAARLDDAQELRRLARRSVAEEVLWAAARGFEVGDHSAARRLFHLAREIDGSIARAPLWWKTAARLALGQRLWQAAAPMLAATRANAAAAPLTSNRRA